jgi:hypothetical protein
MNDMKRSIPFTISPNKKDGYLNIVLDKDKAFFFKNFGFSTYLSDKFINHFDEFEKYENYLDLLIVKIKNIFEEKLNEYGKINIIFPYENSIFIEKIIKKLEQELSINLVKSS